MRTADTNGKRGLALGVMILGVLLAGASAQAGLMAPWVQQAKLTASDAEADDWFGIGVAIEGDIAVVGAHEPLIAQGTGSAYVYERSGGSWSQIAKLTSSDAAAGDAFGRGLAMDNGRIVVGAGGNDEHGLNSGAAYIFEQVGGVWTETAKLVPSDVGAGDIFGVVVDIRGDTALVSSRLDDDAATNAGAAYIFERVGGTWTQQAKLTASDAAANDWFAYSLSLGVDTAVIGVPLAKIGGNETGAAYVFEKPVGGWDDMTETTKLVAADRYYNDQFGIAVGTDGDTIVIGTQWDDDAGSDAGSVYVYERDGGGWTLADKLTASDPTTEAHFGVSVAVDGDMLVAGARWDNDAGSKTGAAYVFENGPTGWGEVAKLTADDMVAGDEAGWCVDICNGEVIVGAHLDDHVRTDAGSAYIYTPEPGALVLLGLGAIGLIRRRRREGGAR